MDSPSPDAASEFDSLYIVLLKAGKQQRRAKVLPFKNLKMGMALGTGWNSTACILALQARFSNGAVDEKALSETKILSHITAA